MSDDIADALRRYGTTVPYDKWKYRAVKCDQGWGISRSWSDTAISLTYLTERDTWHDHHSNMKAKYFNTKAEAEFVIKGFES